MASLSDFFSVSKDSLIPNRPLGTDLYLYMQVNQAIVLLRPKGEALSADQCNTIKKSATTIPIMLKADLKKAMNQAGQTIENAIEDGQDLKSAEVVGAATDILRTMDKVQNSQQLKTSQSSLSTGTPMAEMLANAQGIAEQIVQKVGDQPAALAYDKLLENLQAGEQDPLSIHQQQVSTICILFLLAEGNAKHEEIAEIATAGLIHDIGLAEMPPQVIEKHLTGKEDFNPSETLLYVKPHVTFDLLKKAHPTLPVPVLKAIEMHHENFDGSGLKGIKGAFIPKLSRIIRIADDIAIEMNNSKEKHTFKEALSNIMQANLMKYDMNIIQLIQLQYLKVGEEI